MRAVPVSAVVLLVLLGITWHVRTLPESYPMADTATTSLYALRAGRGSLETGAYSRFGWHHPGPLLYQMLAPAYRLSGYRESSLKWSMTTINAACLATLLWVGWRRAPWLTVCLVATLTPLLWHEQRMVFWSWNPVAALIPLTTALLLAAAVAAGWFSLLPLLTIAVSFIAQSHVGVAPIAILVAMVAAFGAVASSRRDPLRRASLLRWTGLSASCAFVVWFVPVFWGTDNLREILTFWLQAHPRQPWSEVLNAIALELAVPFAWSRELVTGDHVTAAPWQLLWAVVFYPLLALATRVAFRRGERTEGWLGVICLAAALAAPPAIRSIVGEVYEYLVFWLGIVATAGTAMILAMLVRLAVASRPVPASVASLLVAWLVTVLAVTAWRIDYKQRADSSDHTTFHLAEAFDRYAAAHRGSVPLLSFSSRVWHVGAGLVLQVTKRGLPVHVAENQLFLVGDEFKARSPSAIEFYLMAVDEDLPAGVSKHEWLATIADFRLIRIWRTGSGG